MLVASLRQDCWCPDRNPTSGTSRNLDFRRFTWLCGTLTITERCGDGNNADHFASSQTFEINLQRFSERCELLFKILSLWKYRHARAGELYKEALKTASALFSQLDFRLANRSIFPLSRIVLYTAFRSTSSIGWSSQYRIANGTTLRPSLALDSIYQHYISEQVISSGNTFKS